MDPQQNAQFLFMMISHLVKDYILSYPLTSIIIFGLIIVLYKIYKFDEIIVDLKEKELPSGFQRTVDGHTTPPHYPNGWIPILESHFIKRNQLKSIICFGQELVIVRGSSNQIYVIDAYCPHLGANFAVGGSVETGKKENCKNEDCIRCPFHLWAFRMSDGKCVDVPYDDVAPNAKIKIWKSLELNNVIFVWYHAEDKEPDWFPEMISEIDEGAWSYRGRTEHYVNCHFQEIPENGADVEHLNQIHTSSVWMGADVNAANKNRWYSNIMKHIWMAEWNPCSPPNQHMSQLKMINTNKVLGLKLFQLHLDVKQIGPAYVELRFRTNFLGGLEGIMLQLVKPIGPMRNSIVHNIYLGQNSLCAYIFSKLLLISEAIMLARDIRIWNRKAFLSRPYIARTERSLPKYRRWFQQFYSENSKRKERSIDW